MGRHTYAVVWSLVAIFALPAVSLAADKGRLVGKVLDPEGRPVEAVTVTATCTEVSRFHEEDVTDEKGVFKIDFDYLGVVYTLRFQKDGYYPLESKQDWNLEGTAREEFTLHPGQDEVLDVPVASANNMAVATFNQGVEAFNDKDYETAEARFLAALEHDPGLHHAWGALSKVYLHQERFEQAVEASEKAIETGATDESTWRARWEGYHNLGDEEMALQALKDLEDAGLRAEEAKRIHNEGAQLANSGDHETAYRKFEEALEVNPNLDVALLGLATAAAETGRNQQAADAAEAVLATDPENEAALRIRFNAALAIGDEELIVDALSGLAAVEPEVAHNGLLKLAFDAYDGDDMEAAIDRFRRVLEVDPSDARCHYYLGLIHVNRGENQRAMSHLRKFVAIAPDDPEAATAQDLLSYLSHGS